MQKLVATPFVFLPITAYAQVVPGAAKENVPADQAIPSLMFFTLFAALAVAVGGLMYFLRSRSNRDAMKKALND